MKLNNSEKEILLNSLNDLKNKEVDLVDSFYKNFLNHRDIKEMFKGVPMESQKKMFHISLESILQYMDKPYQINIELMNLSQSHKKHGVTEFHLVIFEKAFLQALKMSIKDEFNGETEEVWKKSLKIIMHSMGEML